MTSLMRYSGKGKITGTETRSAVAKSGSGGRADRRGVSSGNSLGVGMVLHFGGSGGYKNLCMCFKS